MFDATYLRSRYTCIYGAGCQGVLDGPGARARAGVLQLRRPLRRRGRRRQRGEGVRPAAARADAVPPGGDRARVPRRRRAGRRRWPRHRHPPRRRRLHLPQPARLRPRRRVRAARGRPRRRRAPARLEAERVLAGADPPRALDRRERSRHVPAAGVEATGLGRGRRRVPLVVHRGRRGVRRDRAGVRVVARRDRRAGGRADLRAARRTARASRAGPRCRIPPCAVADGRRGVVLAYSSSGSSSSNSTPYFAASAA